MSHYHQSISSHMTIGNLMLLLFCRVVNTAMLKYRAVQVVALVFFFVVAWRVCDARSATPTLTVQFSADHKKYDVMLNGKAMFSGLAPLFRFSGQLVDKAVLLGVQSYQGVDSLGGYRADCAEWAHPAMSFVQFVTCVRSYKSLPGVLQFTQQFPVELPGTSTGIPDAVITSFPSAVIPDTAENPIGFVHFSGFMAGSEPQYGTMTKNGSFWLNGGNTQSGVLCLFEKTNSAAVVVAPLTNAMAASMWVDTGKSVHWGVMGNVSHVPAGYSMSWLVVGVDAGVNVAVRTWGDVALRYFNKRRGEARERDFTLQYLGYSTDNGAYYYYYTEPAKNYQQTMADVAEYSRRVGIPFRYFLLDSWWYYRGEANGVSNWTARPDVFPGGLTAVYNDTKWLVQAHNRYFSHDNVYASNNASVQPEGYTGKKFPFAWGPLTGVPQTEDFWDYLFENNRDWGLIVYEQDWLSTVQTDIPMLMNNATFGRQWLMGMGTAADKHHLSIQYCMSYPRHVLTSLELRSVTQARVSDDYQPGNHQWRIAVSSLWSDAIDVAPSKDCFWTQQTPQYNGHYTTWFNISEPRPRLQALIASMSNGPVQPADQIGFSDVALIMRSCNADGLLLRPSVAIAPIDNYFVSLAFGPVIGDMYYTYSTIPAGDSLPRYVYLLSAYMIAPYKLTVADFRPVYMDGSEPPSYYLAYEANTTRQIFMFNDTMTLAVSDGWTFQYHTFVPIYMQYSSGWYLLGEQSKWIAASQQRFSQLDLRSDGSMTVVVTGARFEHVTVTAVHAIQRRLVDVECVLGETMRAFLTVSPNGAAKCLPTM